MSRIKNIYSKITKLVSNLLIEDYDIAVIEEIKNMFSSIEYELIEESQLLLNCYQLKFSDKEGNPIKITCLFIFNDFDLIAEFGNRKHTFHNVRYNSSQIKGVINKLKEVLIND